MSHSYGLPDECYEALMRLDQAVAGLRDHGVQEDRARIRKLNEDFEERWDLTVAKAVKVVLRTDWPGESEAKILERYRKSPKRQAGAPPLFRAVFDHLTPEEQRECTRRGYLADHDLSQGPPLGPEFCGNTGELLPLWEKTIKHIAVTDSADAMAPEHWTPVFRDDETGERWTLERFAAYYAEREGLTAIPVEFMARVVTEVELDTVLPEQLPGLRFVRVCVPLNCPPDVRDAAIAEIVDEWHKRRHEAGGGSLKPRDHSARAIRRLQELPKSLRALTAGKSTEGRQRYSPRTPDTTQSPPEDARARFANLLTEELLKGLGAEWPDRDFDSDTARSVVIDAVERAGTDLFAADAPVTADAPDPPE